MKKLFSLTAAFLSLFLLASCTQTGTDEPSVPSLPNSSESSQSQSKEDPDSLPIYLNAQLKEQNRANQNSCSFIAEDERSYYYRHPTEGVLYRYDKETGRQKILFDKHFEYSQNGFLHSVKLFNNRIYFVTHTADDQVPTLYSIDRNGKNLERIVEWVGDNYILTEDYIYFTHYTFSTSDEGIVQFNRKTKEIKYLEESYCWYLNLVGNSLYYIGAQYDSNNDYTGNPTVCKYNLDSGIREQIDVVGNYTKKLSGLEELYYLDGNLYFRSSYLADENTPISGIYRYNLKTCKTEELLNSSGLSHFGPNLGFGRYVVVSENHIYAISGFKNKTVVSEIKNGVKTFTPYTFSKPRGDTLYIGDRVILVPFFFNEQPLQGYPELNNIVTK